MKAWEIPLFWPPIYESFSGSREILKEGWFKNGFQLEKLKPFKNGWTTLWYKTQSTIPSYGTVFENHRKSLIQ